MMQPRFLTVFTVGVCLTVLLLVVPFSAANILQVKVISDSWAENHSEITTCAEDDNINIPIFAEFADDSGSSPALDALGYRVTATHPTYNYETDSCAPDFSGCGAAPASDDSATLSDECALLVDDHANNALYLCTVADWWRPGQRKMRVTANGQTQQGHYLAWHRKIDGADEWPQFLVLYQDGNLRLKPQPPEGSLDTCLGSSVIVGPALPATRPYVDISRVAVNLTTFCMDIFYLEGGTAHICFAVDRTQAVAEVRAEYPTTDTPFATFRSMWVADGNSDVDHAESDAGSFPIMDWTTLDGRWWFFYRDSLSIHNTSAPDIRIETYISSPPNAAPPRNYFTTDTPALIWNHVTEAIDYEIQVDNNLAFTAPLTYSTLVSADTLFVTVPSLTNGTWYWRVRAKFPNGAVGRWSVTERFIVDAP
jgi:hypothetical protein